MRKAGFGLLLTALVLASARLFTGIVYRADAPSAALVFKREPGLMMERTEAPGRPIGRDIVLDQEEPQLFYGRLYLRTMEAAPAIVLAMVAGAAILLTRGRQRA